MRHEFGASSAHDSAGQPWAGRSFTPNQHSTDDGRGDPALLEQLEAFRGDGATQLAVVTALRGTRLLVPLLAEAGEIGTTPEGRLVDKTQELALVTLRAPDGGTAIPAFTSVAAMSAWNPAARPVPVEAARVALAAGAEAASVILDPGSPTAFGLQRSSLAAIATGEEWVPPWTDQAVLAGFGQALLEPEVRAVDVLPGDTAARLEGPEVVVGLGLVSGLDRPALDALLARVQARWADVEAIAARVGSFGVRLAAAE